MYEIPSNLFSNNHQKTMDIDFEQMKSKMKGGFDSLELDSASLVCSLSAR